jgi:hypothetical protein
MKMKPPAGKRGHQVSACPPHALHHICITSPPPPPLEACLVDCVVQHAVPSTPPPRRALSPPREARLGLPTGP